MRASTHPTWFSASFQGSSQSRSRTGRPTFGLLDGYHLTQAMESRLSPELEQFLAEGPAPIVFTLGTSAVMAAGDFYEESIARRAAARCTWRHAGRVEGVKRLSGKVSKNILIVDAAPHSQLFPKAAVIVQQCGIGTLGQALSAGCPILAVPFAHDQPDNAYRMERLGVARVVYPPQYRAQRVAQELRRLLDQAEYGRAARKWPQRCAPRMVLMQPAMPSNNTCTICR